MINSIIKTIVILVLISLASCVQQGSKTCFNPTMGTSSKSTSESLINTLKEINIVVVEQAKTIFNNMTKSLKLTTWIRLLLTIYIAFLGIQFMFGMIETPQLELVIKLFKIATIITLISDNSWDFFNNHLFDIFTNSTSDLLKHITGTSYPFSFVDQIMQFLFFNPINLIIIFALLISSAQLGVVFFVMIMCGVFQVLTALFRVILVYCMSYIYAAILMSLAPIFIICLLFEQTKHLFEAWIKNFMRISFEPVLLVSGMVFLSNILILTISNIFSYGVCYKCFYQIMLGDLALPCIKGSMINNSDHMGSGILHNIYSKFSEIMLFLIVATFMSKYADFASQISQVIFSSSSSNSGGIGASRGASKGLEQSTLSTVGMDNISRSKRAEERKLEMNYNDTHNKSDET